MDITTCKECNSRIAHSAQFCGFCGSTTLQTESHIDVSHPTQISHAIVDDSALTKSNVPTVRAHAVVSPLENPPTVVVSGLTSYNASLDAYDTGSADLDWEPPRSGRKFAVIGVFAACLLAVTVSIGFLVKQASGSAENVATVAVVSPAVVAAIELPKKPVLKLNKFESTKGKVTYLAETVAKVQSSKGSRYASIDERTKAISVRLNHVLKSLGPDEKDVAVFIARRNGDRHEVSWKREDGSFMRVMDVTKRDVRDWTKKNRSKTSERILANLKADEMNDFFTRKVYKIAPAIAFK